MGLTLTSGLAESLVSCFCILLIQLHTVLAAEFGYTVRVPAAKMECYFQNITNEKYKTMEIDFQVIDGGDLNINFYLLNPHGTTVGSFLQRSDATQRLELVEPRGDYQICFDNTFSYQQQKTVFFEMFMFDQDGNLDEEQFNQMDGLPSLEHMGDMGMAAEQFTQMSTRIKNSLNKAEHYQNLLRAFEYRDRAVMESNIARVNLWSMINTFVLVFVGLVQVYMIRSLFEDHSKVGRILREKT